MGEENAMHQSHAEIEIAGESSPVQAGSVVFVPAALAHYFHSIAEELPVLVV
jgi:mannose-6-phosphate isomerase-like protein (cupin superfamily)